VGNHVNWLRNKKIRPRVSRSQMRRFKVALPTPATELVTLVACEICHKELLLISSFSFFVKDLSSSTQKQRSNEDAQPLLT
jgi:hypothetical protein